MASRRPTPRRHSGRACNLPIQQWPSSRQAPEKSRREAAPTASAKRPRRSPTGRNLKERGTYKLALRPTVAPRSSRHSRESGIYWQPSSAWLPPSPKLCFPGPPEGCWTRAGTATRLSSWVLSKARNSWHCGRRSASTRETVAKHTGHRATPAAIPPSSSFIARWRLPSNSYVPRRLINSSLSTRRSVASRSAPL
jgi:hypothetical protein